MNKDLFQACQLFDLDLDNRIIMAPLTRCRANHHIAGPLQAEYYAQRASAGLIISEASPISAQAIGHLNVPGIYSEQQIQGWQLTTKAVNQQQGKIFCQLWHVGRLSHPDFQTDAALPVAPSAICPPGNILTPLGLKPFVTPRALEKHELAMIIEQYRHAALSAKEAGFHGIEIHAANGYLLDQFLRSGTNHRADEYGGHVHNRMRLILEIIEALTEIWPSQRIGIRISPLNAAHGMFDSNPQHTFFSLIQAINPYHLAYIHCIEINAHYQRPTIDEFDFPALRREFNGYYIANHLYNLELAQQALTNDLADFISFGRPFIANPDLVFRLQSQTPLQEAPTYTWYQGGAHGYTDW